MSDDKEKTKRKLLGLILKIEECISQEEPQYALTALIIMVVSITKRSDWDLEKVKKEFIRGIDCYWEKDMPSQDVEEVPNAT